MEGKSENKKSLFYIIVSILTFIVMIIGASMALYKLVASQKDEGTVLYTGYLEINYVNGVYIKNPDLFPMENVNYNSKDYVYRNTFSIVSSGTLDQTLKVEMEITKNEFSPNALRYALFNTNGNELKRGIVPKETGVVTLADNVFLPNDGKATYTLIVWWQEDGTNQAYEAGHVITGKIIATANQTQY